MYLGITNLNGIREAINDVEQPPMDWEATTAQAPASPHDVQGPQLDEANQGKESNLNQAITQEEIDDFIQASIELLPSIHNMQIAEIEQLRALVEHVNYCQKTIKQRIFLMPHIAKVETALIGWDRQPSTPITTTIAPSTGMLSERTQSTQVLSQVGQYVKYYHLFQYQSELDQQNIRESASQISPQAQKQLKEYNSTGLIEKTRRNKIPNIPIQKAFVRVPTTVQTLTKDQCQYILLNINPNKNVNMREFPQFNPDFQFLCTLYGISKEQEFEQFGQWTLTHQSSQLMLPQNKGLSIHEVEGRFAFEIGCRWVEHKFSVSFNPEWNERVAFYVVNGYQPSNKLQEDTTRASCLRCGNSGSWDGETTYYKCPTAKAMGKCVHNLRNLSIYLNSGKSTVRILSPQAIKVDLSTLPPPKDYENKIILHNSWCNTTKRQLVKHMQERFSPCIFLGAVYLPNFANPKYGVTGRYINMMPRFVNHIAEDQLDKLFRWSLEIGDWITNNQTDLSMYSIYMDTNIPSLEQQQIEHSVSKKFSNQTLDIAREYIYGSNHFWTWYKRDRPNNQITTTPMSIYSELQGGENPFNPQFTAAPMIEQIMLPKHKLSVQNTQTCYNEYIDNTSLTSLEMALRYRRAQMVTGFNAPYLQYQDFGQMRTVDVRIPTIFEFITRSVSQTNLDILRKMSLTRYHWIPREMVTQFDEQTSLTRNKREMAKIRLERVEQEAYEASQQQQEAYGQTIGTRLAHIMQNNQRRIRARSNRLSQSGGPFVYTPYPDQSIGYYGTDFSKLYRAEFHRALSGETIATQYQGLDVGPTPQVLLITDKDSCLMEWDIYNYLTTKRFVRAKVAGLRDEHTKQLHNRMIVEFQTQDDLLLSVELLMPLKDLQVFLMAEEDKISFPIDFNNDVLEQGLNFAKLPAQFTPQSNCLRWFITETEENPMRKYLMMPGTSLGQGYDSSLFYEYEPLTSRHFPVRPQVSVGSRHQIATNYRKQQAQFLKLAIRSFPPLNTYSDDQRKIELAKKIDCPQEARVFLQYSILSPRTQRELNGHEMRDRVVQRRAQNRQLPQQHQTTEIHNWGPQPQDQRPRYNGQSSANIRRRNRRIRNRQQAFDTQPQNTRIVTQYWNERE